MKIKLSTEKPCSSLVCMYIHLPIIVPETKSQSSPLTAALCNQSESLSRPRARVKALSASPDVICSTRAPAARVEIRGCGCPQPEAQKSVKTVASWNGYHPFRPRSSVLWGLRILICPRSPGELLLCWGGHVLPLLQASAARMSFGIFSRKTQRTLIL